MLFTTCAKGFLACYPSGVSEGRDTSVCQSSTGCTGWPQPVHDGAKRHHVGTHAHPVYVPVYQSYFARAVSETDKKKKTSRRGGRGNMIVQEVKQHEDSWQRQQQQCLHRTQGTAGDDNTKQKRIPHDVGLSYKIRRTAHPGNQWEGLVGWADPREDQSAPATVLRAAKHL